MRESIRPAAGAIALWALMGVHCLWPFNTIGFGAPFKDWVLPASLERIRRKLAGSDDGDRQIVKILAAVLNGGLPAVEAACAEALAEGVHSANVIINILARRRARAAAGGHDSHSGSAEAAPCANRGLRSL